jgi:hypothetical protein
MVGGDPAAGDPDELLTGFWYPPGREGYHYAIARY